MSLHILDAKGMKCPGPTLKMTSMTFQLKPGDVLEVIADCATFEKDVRDWCSRNRKTLIMFRDEGSQKKCQIQF